MKARSEFQIRDNSRRYGRSLPAAIAAFALVLGTSTAVFADDSEESSPFGDAAIDDLALSQTVGIAQGAISVIQNVDGEGSVQSVSIGSYNNGRGFGSYNAVAVAVIEQDAVQIVGTDLTEAITAD